MEDIEVNTTSVEASEPAEPDLAESDLAESNLAEREPAERPTVDETPGAEEPEEIVAEQLLIVEDAAAPDMERARLRAIIEAVVYVTDEPLTLQQIAAALNHPIDKVQGILEELIADYNRPERGLSIREVAGGYKMTTRPEHHEAVRTFVRNLKPPLKLSLAALETLAVVAYKQPVTAPEIMEIRGVQGVGVLKTLLDRKLIAVAGRKNVVGKPILYKTTRDFLIQFGLSDLAELPTLKEFEELGRMALSDVEPEAASAPSAAQEAAGEAAGRASAPIAAEPVQGEPGPAEAAPVETVREEPALEEADREEPAPDEPAPVEAAEAGREEGVLEEAAQAEPGSVEPAPDEPAPVETAEAGRQEGVLEEAAPEEAAQAEPGPVEPAPVESVPGEVTTVDAVAPDTVTPEATTTEEG
jgi:segregation and condensation protein B